MGLDTSHNCWHGSYSGFMAFRRELAKAAGMPPLDSMKGFGGNMPWDELKPDAVHVLLNHSDCEGEIAVVDCLPLAERLEHLAPTMPDEWYEETLRFAAGLRKAAALNEPVDFH